MYVVLMAMLALNVSNEVLNGFSIVEESLNRTTSNSSKENLAIYETFEQQMKANPQKTKEWYDKAQQVRQMSDSLYNFAASLKQAIVIEADGEDGDVTNIRNKEDQEPANYVMLSPTNGQGQKLYDAINSFRNRMLTMVTDEKQRKIIASNLTTDVPKRAMGKNWQEYMFESMPAAAAVTLLSKLQSDVRYAEGEVLHKLVQNIDVKDIRVNLLDAFVIPNSKTIVRGDRFSARIVMAAVDTTQVPDIFIGGQKLNLQNGLYETVCGKTGDFTLKGYMEMVNGNGERIRREFSQDYTVVEPSATVSADLMNMLYAGYANPISISVPGVPLNKVQASMTNGTLQAVGPGKYIAKPSKIGQNAVITVTSTNTGRPQQMGQYTFRVRKLPDPTPFISMKDEHGNPTRYRGGGLAKSQLVAVEHLGAAIDDGILDIAFRVQSFETVFFDNMGNAVPMASDGAQFSGRQKDAFRKLQRNRRFYISRVTVVGPDGLTRTLTRRRDIYREISLDEDANGGLYYPVEPQGKQLNLFTYIFKLALNGYIPIYEYPTDGSDVFTEEAKVDMKNLLHDYHIHFEEQNGRLKVDNSDIPSADVKKYYLKESAYYDQANSSFHIKVQALCPVMVEEDDFSLSDDNGEKQVTQYPLFWVKYSELEPFLNRQTIMASGMNNAAQVSMDDFFTLNMYRGKIYKTNNAQGKTLSQLCNGDKEKMTAEQKRIEAELEAFKKTIFGDPAKRDSLDSIAAVNDTKAGKKVKAAKNKPASTKGVKVAKQKSPKPEKASSSSNSSARVAVRRQRH